MTNTDKIKYLSSLTLHVYDTQHFIPGNFSANKSTTAFPSIDEGIVSIAI